MAVGLPRETVSLRLLVAGTGWLAMIAGRRADRPAAAAPPAAGRRRPGAGLALTGSTGEGELDQASNLPLTSGAVL